MKNTKIFILGAPKVGKTSLIHQIVFGPTWIEHTEPQPTIEDVYFTSLDTAPSATTTATNQHAHHHHGEKHNVGRDERVLFFDVAGIKPNIDIESLKSYISYADEFVLVYSIDDRSTFNLVDTIKKLIDQSKGKHDHRIIVLGNKVDLDSQRQVGFDEALIWAKREGIKLFEVTSFERVTLLDFTRYLSAQLTTAQIHTSSSFKLR